MRNALMVSLFGIALVFGCSSSPATTDGGSDASTDVKPDKVKSDSGGDSGLCASGLTCEVCDGSFTPVQMAAPLDNAAACSDADIAAFVTACGANGDQNTCDAWQTAEQTSAPACLACTFTNNTDQKFGVFVCDPNSGDCFYNTPGCLDVALGTVSQEKQAGGSGSCGDLYSDAYGCENYSCNSCTTQSEYDTCLQSADANECKVYADPAYSTTGKCAAVDDASATVNSCFVQTDADLNTMTTIMCGGLVVITDAGGDGEGG